MGIIAIQLNGLNSNVFFVVPCFLLFTEWELMSNVSVELRIEPHSFRKALFITNMHMLFFNFVKGTLVAKYYGFT